MKTKYRIVERKTCEREHSYTGYIIQYRFLGMWWDYDNDVTHSELEYAKIRLKKIIEMRNCKNTQRVVVEKEV